MSDQVKRGCDWGLCPSIVTEKPSGPDAALRWICVGAGILIAWAGIRMAMIVDTRSSIWGPIIAPGGAALLLFIFAGALFYVFRLMSRGN